MSKVAYNQAGYVGQSMSQRAAYAYDDYKMPRSKWTKALMLEAIRYELLTVCKRNERDQIMDLINKMTKKKIWDKFFEYDSWHHTGKFATPTDFYGVSEYYVCEYAKEILREKDED